MSSYLSNNTSSFVQGYLSETHIKYKGTCFTGCPITHFGRRGANTY